MLLRYQYRRLFKVVSIFFLVTLILSSLIFFIPLLFPPPTYNVSNYLIKETQDGFVSDEVSGNNTIYVLTKPDLNNLTINKINAINKNGKLLWSYPIADPFSSTQLLAGSDNQVLALVYKNLLPTIELYGQFGQVWNLNISSLVPDSLVSLVVANAISRGFAVSFVSVSRTTDGNIVEATLNYFEIGTAPKILNTLSIKAQGVTKLVRPTEKGDSVKFGYISKGVSELLYQFNSTTKRGKFLQTVNFSNFAFGKTYIGKITTKEGEIRVFGTFNLTQIEFWKNDQMFASIDNSVAKIYQSFAQKGDSIQHVEFLPGRVLFTAYSEFNHFAQSSFGVVLLNQNGLTKITKLNLPEADPNFLISSRAVYYINSEVVILQELFNPLNKTLKYRTVISTPSTTNPVDFIDTLSLLEKFSLPIFIGILFSGVTVIRTRGPIIDEHLYPSENKNYKEYVEKLNKIEKIADESENNDI